MEVGYQNVYNLVPVTGSNNNLRAGVQGFQAVAVEPGDNVRDGPHGSDAVDETTLCPILVWFPLAYMQLLLRGIGIVLKPYTYII